MSRRAPCAVLSFCFLLGLCTCRLNMLPREMGRSDAVRKVFVAGESTAFKEQVVKRWPRRWPG